MTDYVAFFLFNHQILFLKSQLPLPSVYVFLDHPVWFQKQVNTLRIWSILYRSESMNIMEGDFHDIDSDVGKKVSKIERN